MSIQKRIGRNQQNLFDEELKDFTQKYAGFNHVHTPTPIAAMNFATPAQLISLTQPQFNAIDTNNFMEAGGLLFFILFFVIKHFLI